MDKQIFEMYLNEKRNVRNLKSAYVDLNCDHQNLKYDYDILVNDIKILRAKFDKAKIEKQILAAETASLAHRYEVLDSENRHLDKENRHLKNLYQEEIEKNSKILESEWYII